MAEKYRITYVMDNKLGGVTSLNYNLIKHAPAAVEQEVILLDNASDAAARPSIRFPVQKETLFHIDPRGNFYHTLKKLHGFFPGGPGALVVNYGTEMTILDHFPANQTVYQLVHDNYNFGLAKEYGHVVDVFISHNIDMYEKLLKAFPERSSDIFYLPHGVNLPSVARKPAGADAVLKLLFLGRFTRGKGIQDLPVIASLLRNRGVRVEWTCIGAGPEESDFKNSWDRDDKVNFISPSSNDEVLAVCAAHDIFILPTKFEGSPVSLLEAMSVGLVPVISDLPGGIRETVSADIGFRISLNDNEAFAEAVEKLHHNRELLERMSHNCRQRIASNFDIRLTSKGYFSLFARFEEFYKTKRIKKRKIGSRLDQPWIPNGFTRFVRSCFK